MITRKVLFLTGTRADFGKLKPLMKAVENSSKLECSIFVTGMHTMSRYGLTVNEIYKEKFNSFHVYMNQVHGDPMDLVLANTIIGFSRYISEYRPDMIVVHGDRVEALAGAIVGSLNNILVAHVEGGELSGTIDGIIRHSISKLSHVHFVANGEAFNRLKQLGEDEKTVFSIGSPDIDVMLSPELPTLDEAKQRYDIKFNRYGIVLFHSVTTELDMMLENTNQLVAALLDNNNNYVVIYPNNDKGCEDIFAAYRSFEGNPRFKLFPSLRFEYFLTLLKNADFLIGNSSAGVREAPVYGVYSINIGSRQEKRFSHSSIINVDYDKDSILRAINLIKEPTPCKPCYTFGKGESSQRFINILEGEEVWKINKQKVFQDLILEKVI